MNALANQRVIWNKFLITKINFFMNDNDKYLELASEIIQKQSVILGPDIAILKARSIKGISIDDNGKVTEISGNADEIIQELVDAFVALSGQIVKSALSSVFTKYPQFNKKVDQ